jgi:hypothetical protein
MEAIVPEKLRTCLPVGADLEYTCAVTQEYKLVYASGVDPGRV